LLCCFGLVLAILASDQELRRNVWDLSFCFKSLFDSFVGTTGIVDYTNYEDMKYAVS